MAEALLVFIILACTLGIIYGGEFLYKLRNRDAIIVAN